MEAVQVAKVPPISKGPIKYEVEYNEKDPLHSMTDNFNWGRSQPCRRKGFCTGGRRTLQICRGSLECQNPKCQYQKIHKFTNKVDFNCTNKCVHCKHIALRINCSARKYIKNDCCHRKMTVIYVGDHACSLRAMEDKPEKEEVADIMRERPTIASPAKWRRCPVPRECCHEVQQCSAHSLSSYLREQKCKTRWFQNRGYTPSER